MLKKGQAVILIDDESPAQEARRKGLEQRALKIERQIAKGKRRSQRVGYVDVVDKVKPNLKMTVDRAFAGHGDGLEIADAAQARKQKGEPKRRAYPIDLRWFPTPFGLPGPGDRIDIDEDFMERVVKTHSANK